MPITIKRVIRFIITNNTIYNGKKDEETKQTEKQLNQAKRVKLRVKSETFKSYK